MSAEPRRIIGHVVTRNEVDRYLEPCLRWLQTMVDVVHVFDDRSSDDTPDLAAELGALVDIRLASSASFLEHEGTFRRAGWKAMERAVEAEDGDWVLSIDADEFPVCTGGMDDERRQLRSDARYALSGSRHGMPAWDARTVTFPVAEVFDFGGARPLVRKDGFWGQITADRLVRWSPDDPWLMKPSGGGSVPITAGYRVPALGTTILHYGYARSEDREEKYRRYVGERGHNKRHVDSILRRGQLEPWTWRVPDGV